MDEIREEWRPVREFEGIYEVSNFGVIRRAADSKSWAKGRVLKQVLDRGGYLQVRLYQGNDGITRKVHRIVVEAFVGLRPKGFDINHKDSDKTNNHLFNLEFVTRSENMLHRYKAAPRRPNSIIYRGVQRPHKLSEAQVREILHDTRSNRKVASDMGVIERTIRAIRKGQIWHHIWLQEKGSDGFALPAGLDEIHTNDSITGIE